ncbi:MAG: hypothetical protein AAGA35_01360 [Patescibacteria group bacterium]
MKLGKIKLTLMVLSALFVLPQASQAYFTTDQSAFLISDNAALLTISYSFGFSSREALLPIAAVRGETESQAVLGYELLEDSRASTSVGTAAGIIVSDAEVRNGQYYIPAGQTADFTLVVVLTTEPTDPEIDYALQVSHLPFTMITADGTVLENGLTDSELSYYISPEVDLNEE